MFVNNPAHTIAWTRYPAGKTDEAAYSLILLHIRDSEPFCVKAMGCNLKRVLLYKAQSEKQRGCPLGHRFRAKKPEHNYLIPE